MGSVTGWLAGWLAVLWGDGGNGLQYGGGMEDGVWKAYGSSGLFKWEAAVQKARVCAVA